MRALAFLSLFFFLSSLLCGGQEKVSPFVFEETAFDFGTAREDGGELVHEYRFTNVSSDTVFIMQIRSLCRCTKGEAFPRVVLPGERGLIRVTFNPYGYSGPQYKGVTVVSGTKSEDKLTFSVDLLPRKKSVEEEYPVTAGESLRVDKTEFNFLQLPAGGSKSLSLRFANVSGQPRHIIAGTPHGSGLLSVSCPDAVPPGGTGEVVMTYTAKPGSEGFHSDSFVLSTEDFPEGIAIEVKVVVTDDFSRLPAGSPAPSLKISGGTYLNLGTLPSSSGVRRVSYTLKNEGTAPLTIRDVDCPEGMSVTIGKGLVVAPGSSRSFDILLDTLKFPAGALFKTVRLLSDDPSSPVKELMIAARIADRQKK